MASPDTRRQKRWRLPQLQRYNARTFILAGDSEMKKLCSRVFVVFALILTGGATCAIAQTVPSPSADNSVSGDYRSALLADVTDMAHRFVDLAQAFPAEKYTWRPEEGVRSVSEVFLHISGGAFALPRNFGAPPPVGFTTTNGYEQSTTDKPRSSTSSISLLRISNRPSRTCRTPISRSRSNCLAGIRRGSVSRTI